MGGSKVPKIDRTFTNRDVLRIFCNNLDKSEQNKVLLFFWLILPAFFGFDLIIDAVLFLLPGRAGRLVSRGLTIAGLVLSRFSAILLTLMVPKEDQDVVLACLNKFEQ